MRLPTKACIAAFVLMMGAAQASLISGSVATSGGKAVNLSGLEWLSFDDTTLGTFNVSRDTIEAQGSPWMMAGWRYATAFEYLSLIQSLGITAGGITNGYYDTNNDGVGFLLSMWGRYTVPAYQGTINAGLPSEALFWVNAYDQHWGYFGEAFFAGSTGTERYSYVGHVQSPILKGYDYRNDALYPDITDYTPAYHYSNVYDRTSRSGAEFGSFLVRGAPPRNGPGGVPEPTTLALVAAALLGVAAIRRHEPTTLNHRPASPMDGPKCQSEYA